MVTVFTPTYNRVHTIGKLYESLCGQTNKDFEWIIIDDGSTDETDEYVHKIVDTNQDFPVIYRKISNHGKHFAINLGVTLASSEAFFIVDSDDYLTEDAIEFIEKEFVIIENNYSFAGIAGQKINSRIPDPVFNTYVDATNLERNKYNLLGDKAEVYKTSVLRKYPFPYFEGENFLTEEVIWNRIAHEGLKIRWFNKGIYFCEYLEDGLTNKGIELFIKNPMGWARWIRDSIELGIWTKDQVFNECLLYFEFGLINKTPSEICDLLGILNEDFKEYEEVISNNVKIINEQFEKYRKIAIYGYGKNGLRIYNYIKMLNREVQYFIDRTKKSTEKKVYLPLDSWPEVDAIIISLSKSDQMLINCVTRKMKSASVIELNKMGLDCFA